MSNTGNRVVWYTHQDEQEELSRVVANLEQIEMSVDTSGISSCFTELSVQRTLGEDSTHTSNQHEDMKRPMRFPFLDDIPQLRSGEYQESDQTNYGKSQ